MRVAYLVNQYPKVSHSFIRREIQALEAQGVEVARFSVQPVREALADPADEAEAKRTRAVLSVGAAGLASAMLRMKLSRPGRYWRAWRSAVRMGRRSEVGVARHVIYLAEACVLAQWLREADARHLHAHFGTNSAAVALLTHLLTGVPYSFTVHGPEEFDRPGRLSLTDKIERAAFVVAISSFGRSQLYRWCDHAHWPKVHVVHCGLDEAFLSASNPGLSASEAPDESILSDQSGPSSLRSSDPASAARFVCVGRLCEQKGQLLLIEAAARLAREGRDFRLVLVGDGEMRGEIETLIQRHGLHDRVNITGWASGERVREELSRCRAMVLPSFAEGLPVAIMEALALGRPVITTGIAGIPELVTPACGWLIPAGSIDDLTAAMRACLDAGDDDLARMGAAGAQRVRERHDARIEAAKLAKLFAEAGGAR